MTDYGGRRNTRLTSHQLEVLSRLRRLWSRRGEQPVVESDVGSVGALRHLERKGHVRIARVEYGSRGGERRYWEPVVPSPLGWRPRERSD